MKKKNIYPQTGKTNLHFDRMQKAKLPGWRISKSGKKYFEARRNRSDRKGKMI